MKRLFQLVRAVHDEGHADHGGDGDDHDQHGQHGVEHTDFAARLGGGRGGGGAEVAGRAAADAIGAGGAAAVAAGGREGSLMVGAEVGLGGRAMRTVSFFGCTLAASAGLGGREPMGASGLFSAINQVRFVVAWKLRFTPEGVKLLFRRAMFKKRRAG